jgi:hypothetical protein
MIRMASAQALTSAQCKIMKGTQADMDANDDGDCQCTDTKFGALPTTTPFFRGVLSGRAGRHGLLVTERPPPPNSICMVYQGILQL